MLCSTNAVVPPSQPREGVLSPAAKLLLRGEYIRAADGKCSQISKGKVWHFLLWTIETAAFIILKMG